MLVLFLLFVARIILFVLGFVLLYAIAALFLSWLPANRRQKKSRVGIPIHILSNGVHTDIVVPATHQIHDWFGIIDLQPYALSKPQINLLAFGWGDRGFYLDTPTWAELKFKTAVNAMLIPSPTLMHVTAYEELPLDMKHCETLFLSDLQYKELCNYIYSYFDLTSRKEVRLIADVGYTPNDNFYHAQGAYHAFNTCNYWVNRGLRKIGIRTSIWSPTDKGIFYQLKRLEKTS